MKHCKSVGSEALLALPESITFCATVNEAGDEQVITEMMIRRACEQAEDSQMWPYVGMPCKALTPPAVMNQSSAVIIPFPSQGRR